MFTPIFLLFYLVLVETGPYYVALRFLELIALATCRLAQAWPGVAVLAF